MMDKRSNAFWLISLGAVALLALAFHSIYEDLLKAAVLQRLGRVMGMSEAELTGRLTEMSAPIVAAIAVVWFVYAYFKRDFERQLAFKLTPKIKCSFNMSDTLCIRPNTVISLLVQPIGLPQDTVVAPGPYARQIPCTYFRVRVTADNVGHVSDCSGYLISLEREGISLLAGETIPLPFTPAEAADTHSKTVYDKRPCSLDFLAVTQDNEIIITSAGYQMPSSVPSFESIFAEPGEYHFEIVVTSPVSASSAIRLRMSWRNDWRTLQISQIS